MRVEGVRIVRSGKSSPVFDMSLDPEALTPPPRHLFSHDFSLIWSSELWDRRGPHMKHFPTLVIYLKIQTLIFNLISFLISEL